jgi:hypothetical protein
MEGSNQELHIAAREFWRRLRRHPKIAIAAFVVWLVEESFSHRFFEWFNHTIDDYGLRAMSGTLDSLMWISSNPLGITGIVVIFVLLLTFIHSYISVAYGKKVATAIVGRILTLVVITGGVAMTWRFTADQSLPARLVLGLLVWGAIGAAMNEGFLRMSQAQAPMENLAHHLDNLGNWISNPPTVIGEQTSVTVTGPGSGNVIGKRTEVIVGPGAPGNVIGSQTTVSVGGAPDPKLIALANEFRQAAQSVRGGGGSRETISSLIEQSKQVPNAALRPVIADTEHALASSGLK